MVEDGEMPTAVISERDAGRAKRRVREREEDAILENWRFEIVGFAIELRNWQ